MGINIIKCDNCDSLTEEQKMIIKEYEENEKISKERDLNRYYRLRYLGIEAIQKLGNNFRSNAKLLLKIDDENQILVPKMKAKIA